MSIKLDNKILLTIILVCGWAITLIGQPLVFPVRGEASVIVGGSVYVGDFANPMATADRLRYSLVLQDPVEQERTVYFKLSIIQNGAVIAFNPPGFRGNQVTLQRNVPLFITGVDLEMNLNINNLVGFSGSAAPGVLNEGITDFCIEVIDAFREEPISGRICATGYLARLQAPILILPAESQRIFTNQLNNLVFTWQMTDPLAHLPFVNIDYLFEIREKSPLLDPQDQFENNALIFSAEVNNFSVFYNEISSQLDPGKVYLWRVVARFYDPSGIQIPTYFVNNGISRVGIFHVLPNITIDPGSAGVQCACPPEECDGDIPDYNLLTQSLGTGDSIQYGAFRVLITRMTGGGSGEGRVRIPFINQSVEVRFQNIMVNQQYQVIQGSMQPVLHPMIQSITSDAVGLPDLSAIPVNNSFVSQLNSHVNEIRDAFSLPMSLGNNLARLGWNIPFDIYITDFAFSTFGAATVNLLLFIPGSNNQIYAFGASGVRIGRSGLDIAGLKLFLLQDATLPGLSNIPITIKRATLTSEQSGSFIAFGCNGLELFNLQASYTFSRDQIIQVDNDLPVEALFTLQATQWGQFIGYGQMPSFEAVGAPGWVFTVDGVAIDFSIVDNPTHIQFPDEYDTTGPEWRGFYLETVVVQLPDDFNFSGTENPLTASANHIIIDALGVSCRLMATDILDISTGNIGGWGISLDTLLVDIRQNIFIHADLIGGINIDLLGATIDYAGLVYRAPDGGYVFDLSPLGSFEIPFIKITASIETGSLIGIRRTAGTGSYRPFADLNLDISIQALEDEFRNSGVGALLDELMGLLGLSGFQIDISSFKFKNFKINHPDLPEGKRFSLGSFEGGDIQIPGLGSLSLGDFMFLEQESNFNGVSLPGIGLDFQLNYGLMGIGLGIWAKDDSNASSGSSSSGGGSSPKFKFGKFEVRLPDFSGLSFKCQCVPPDPASGSPDFCTPPSLSGGTATPILEGSRVKIGHFTMRIDSIDSPTSGRGKIELPFLGILMEVQYREAILHTMTDGSLRLVNGTVLSTPSNLLDNIDIPVPEIPGPIDLSSLDITETFLSQISDLASQAGAFFALPISIREKMKQLFNVDMPEGFDFILLGMRFDPIKANLNAVLSVKLPGNNYMKFGLAGMNIRPDGFNLDGIKIYLAEDFTPNFD